MQIGVARDIRVDRRYLRWMLRLLHERIIALRRLWRLLGWIFVDY